jgi:hypothetical protein
MPTRYDNFEKSPLGEELKRLVSGERRLIEFRAFSREGFPAVTALVSEVLPLLEGIKDPKERNFIKQSIGDFVARVMRDDGYEKVGQRSVPGKLFTVGALWKRAKSD